jgi:hypothetical protein
MCSSINTETQVMLLILVTNLLNHCTRQTYVQHDDKHQLIFFCFLPLFGIAGGIAMDGQHDNDHIITWIYLLGIF